MELYKCASSSRVRTDCHSSKAANACVAIRVASRRKCKSDMLEPLLGGGTAAALGVTEFHPELLALRLDAPCAENRPACSSKRTARLGSAFSNSVLA
eukprot:Nitzschia sp. Nitz4//scaffold268_size26297//418//708//NITZ4_008275-RA/size26297-exonerate_est2genome-gene-0.0-mRNA-1//1//CDS//3329544924//3137//frame0